jgi:hypothetical protein
MKKGLRYFLITWLFNSSCIEKIDFEMASGIIIGREVCNTNSALNAWLISLQPTPTRAFYGKDISYKGKAYKNVVKTYSPEASSIDSTKQYTFLFYLENVIANPVCDQPAANPVEVPQIRVREASKQL